MATILCDLDGTLLSINRERRTHVPSPKLVAFNRALADEFGVADLDYRAGSDHGLTDWLITERAVQTVRPEVTIDGPTWQRICARVEEALVTPPPGDDPLYLRLPGIPTTLEALRDAGYRLGIVTGNVASTAMHKLAAAGIDRGLFDGAVGFGDHGRERAQILRLALARAGDEPLLVLGDTPRDLEGAEQVGLPFLGVGTTVLTVDHLAAARTPSVWLPDLGDADAVREAVVRLFADEGEA